MKEESLARTRGCTLQLWPYTYTMNESAETFIISRVGLHELFQDMSASPESAHTSMQELCTPSSSAPGSNEIFSIDLQKQKQKQRHSSHCSLSLELSTDDMKMLQRSLCNFSHTPTVPPPSLFLFRAGSRCTRAPSFRSITVKTNYFTPSSSSLPSHPSSGTLSTPLKGTHR